MTFPDFVIHVDPNTPRADLEGIHQQFVAKTGTTPLILPKGVTIEPIKPPTFWHRPSKDDLPKDLIDCLILIQPRRHRMIVDAFWSQDEQLFHGYNGDFVGSIDDPRLLAWCYLSDIPLPEWVKQEATDE